MHRAVAETDAGRRDAAGLQHRGMRQHPQRQHRLQPGHAMQFAGQIACCRSSPPWAPADWRAARSAPHWRSACRSASARPRDRRDIPPPPARTAASVSYSSTPAWSPVKGRPVRLAPLHPRRHAHHQQPRLHRPEARHRPVEPIRDWRPDSPRDRRQDAGRPGNRMAGRRSRAARSGAGEGACPSAQSCKSKGRQGLKPRPPAPHQAARLLPTS